MNDINIEINVCDSTGKATCTIHPPVQVNSHTCCHSNNSGGQEPGVSGVASVFGRTGVVTAQVGDYTADQITETATRKFASPDEKATWNAKQDALISGTNIRTLFGQPLLGSGDISLTPAQMGVAAAVHTHTTSDITDYTQKTKQLIHSSLEAGAGVTLSYNPSSEKTIISAVGGSGTGGSGYIVADRQGATAGQNHLFSIRPQNTFNLAAYALKEEAGAVNQTYVVDDFNASSEPGYNVTSAVIFDGAMQVNTNQTLLLQADGENYSANVRSAGKKISVRSITDDYAVPVMTSNITSIGYIASASSVYHVNYEPFYAFDRTTSTNNGKDAWAASRAATAANPEWLQIALPNAISISRYQIVNRAISIGNNPVSWKLQGSNDGVMFYDIHTVSGDRNITLGAIRNFNISVTGKYSIYRLYITEVQNTSSWTNVGQLNLFDAGSNMVINSGGENYGFINGALVEIDGDLTAEKIKKYGNPIFEINLVENEISSMVSVVSDKQLNINVKLTPHSQIAIQKSLSSAAAWRQINSARLTATQTGKGKVRVAVTRDLVNWHVLRNGAWVDVGALSADTAGAEALIADGMTPAELGGITAAQWAQLFSSNNGVPDSLAFAFALDITDPETDVATIDRLVLNVNDASSWKVQTQAEVEIRWRTDSVTFRTAAAGNYKLAYQVP
ncbi:discoidin domain-containing protein [Pectobacterium polaris]|uniref:discoidin domain-containing protein n=1 Tax=Pectobacterium polaris TaxID=2042057 RepID=UPI0032EBDB8E